MKSETFKKTHIVDVNRGVVITTESRVVKEVSFPVLRIVVSAIIKGFPLLQD